jgi:hypothetical protein
MLRADGAAGVARGADRAPPAAEGEVGAAAGRKDESATVAGAAGAAAGGDDEGGATAGVAAGEAVEGAMMAGAAAGSTEGEDAGEAARAAAEMGADGPAGSGVHKAEVADVVAATGGAAEAATGMEDVGTLPPQLRATWSAAERMGQPQLHQEQQPPPPLQRQLGAEEEGEERQLPQEPGSIALWQRLMCEYGGLRRRWVRGSFFWSRYPGVIGPEPEHRGLEAAVTDMLTSDRFLHRIRANTLTLLFTGPCQLTRLRLMHPGAIVEILHYLFDFVKGHDSRAGLGAWEEMLAGFWDYVRRYYAARPFIQAGELIRRPEGPCLPLEALQGFLMQCDRRGLFRMLYSWRDFFLSYIPGCPALSDGSSCPGIREAELTTLVTDVRGRRGTLDHHPPATVVTRALMAANPQSPSSLTQCGLQFGAFLHAADAMPEVFGNLDQVACRLSHPFLRVLNPAVSLEVPPGYWSEEDLLAVTMARHPRLGAQSLLSLVDGLVIRDLVVPHLRIRCCKDLLSFLSEELLLSRSFLNAMVSITPAERDISMRMDEAEEVLYGLSRWRRPGGRARRLFRNYDAQDDLRAKALDGEGHGPSQGLDNHDCPDVSSIMHKLRTNWVLTTGWQEDFNDARTHLAALCLFIEQHSHLFGRLYQWTSADAGGPGTGELRGAADIRLFLEGALAGCRVPPTGFEHLARVLLSGDASLLMDALPCLLTSAPADQAQRWELELAPLEERLSGCYREPCLSWSALCDKILPPSVRYTYFHMRAEAAAARLSDIDGSFSPDLAACQCRWRIFRQLMSRDETQAARQAAPIKWAAHWAEREARGLVPLGMLIPGILQEICRNGLGSLGPFIVQVIDVLDPCRTTRDCDPLLASSAPASTLLSISDSSHFCMATSNAALRRSIRQGQVSVNGFIEVQSCSIVSVPERMVLRLHQVRPLPHARVPRGQKFRVGSPIDISTVGSNAGHSPGHSPALLRSVDTPAKGSMRSDHHGPHRLDTGQVGWGPYSGAHRTGFSRIGHPHGTKVARHPPADPPGERAMLPASSANPPGIEQRPPASSEAGGSQ